MKDSDFSPKFIKALNNLKFIEDLPYLLVFNKLFKERALETMPMLAYWYAKDEEEVKGIISAGFIKSMDSMNLSSGIEGYEVFENKIIQQRIKLEKEHEDEKVRNSLKWWNDNVYIEVAMCLKVRVYNHVSKFNYRISIHDLYKKAKGGDESSLLKLLRIDKTILLTDWASWLIENKQYDGDWKFFKKIGKSISEEPLKEPSNLIKVEVLAVHFWEDYLKNMKYDEIWELFQEHDLIAQEMDVAALKMFLYRLGLKKYTK